MLKYQFFIKGFDPKKDKFSLLVEDSDYIINESVLNGLIGTLVKFGPSGKIEPYLAESFSMSSDGKVWTYTLRENITCSDGTPITATSFVDILTSNLQSYSKNSGTMDFELLLGWEDFIANRNKKPLLGLKADNNKVVFEFYKRPENLHEFLRMPYFGFWRRENTKALGTSFISSGPFTLTPHSSEHEIILNKRTDWFSTSSEKKYPSMIKFSLIGEKDLLQSKENTIVELFTANQVDTPSGFVEIYSSPLALLSLVVSPIKDGPFKNIQNRRAFLERFDKAKRHSKFNAEYFYLSCKSNITKQSNLSFTPEMKGYEINVAFQNRSYSVEDEQEIKHLITIALEDSGAKVQFHAKNPFEDNWRQRLLSNAEFDIRMNAVDIGVHIRNWVIKMMFCSKLGVSYPDPSGRICDLTNEVNNNGGPYTQSQIERFNQILHEDASVIPLTHYGTKWILTSDIDQKSFSSMAISPLYEAIKFT